MLKRLGKVSGVADVHPHRYRHTTITNAINRGMPLQDAQEMAGYADSKTTMLYCAINKEKVKAGHRLYLAS